MAQARAIFPALSPGFTLTRWEPLDAAAAGVSNVLATGLVAAPAAGAVAGEGADAGVVGVALGAGDLGAAAWLSDMGVGSTALVEVSWGLGGSKRIV